MTGYHAVRFTPSAKRDVVWQALWRHFFRNLIAPTDCVLDIGCGYGHFINHVVARRRIALDAWPDFPRYVGEGVECIVGDLGAVDGLEDRSVDHAFASNVFEHVGKAELRSFLELLAPKLSPAGTLIILQPNWYYAFREYFDDYDHVTPWSHVSLPDFLSDCGYEPFDVRKRFLPLTVKSRLPSHALLVRLYLMSPIKPFAKQMLVRARQRG